VAEEHRSPDDTAYEQNLKYAYHAKVMNTFEQVGTPLSSWSWAPILLERCHGCHGSRGQHGFH